MRASVLAALGCCVSTPLHAEPSLTDADFGLPPSELLTEAKTLIGSTLKDPHSATYTVSETYKGLCKKGVFKGAGLEWIGWASNIAVNARNSYGAYTGIVYVTVLFKGNEAIRVIDGENFGAYGPSKGLLGIDGGANVCKRFKPSAPARLGIAYNVVSEGFVIERVESDSVASRSGLKPKMIVAAIDGRSIVGASVDQVQRALTIMGRNITLLLSNGKSIELQLVR